MGPILSEFVFSLRRLRASWQFSAIVIATLALGIGAACSIFSAVNAVLIQPLPFADPARLQVFTETFNKGSASVSWLNYLDWRKRNTTFSEIGLAYVDGANLIAEAAPDRPKTAYVSASMGRVLGVPAFRGRLLNEADETGERARTLLLSYGYWQRHFHGACQHHPAGPFLRFARLKTYGVAPILLGGSGIKGTFASTNAFLKALSARERTSPSKVGSFAILLKMGRACSRTSELKT